MKVKTSISLSRNALRIVDRLAKAGLSRSAVIERAVLEYAQRSARATRNERDVLLLNQNADDLNRETLELLAFQSE